MKNADEQFEDVKRRIAESEARIVKEIGKPKPDVTTRLDGIDARIERVVTSMEAMRGNIEAMQDNIAAHDAQIDSLITISAENAQNWKNLEKQWQAYLNRLPKQ